MIIIAPYMYHCHCNDGNIQDMPEVIKYIIIALVVIFLVTSLVVINYLDKKFKP